MSTAETREQHRTALIALIQEHTEVDYDGTSVDYELLADKLLDAGWRPAYDGDLQLFRDAAGDWRWRAVADNGQVVAGPEEGYTDREHAADMAMKITGIGSIEEQS